MNDEGEIIFNLKRGYQLKKYNWKKLVKEEVVVSENQVGLV